jgi:peptide/nickel transport system substrate-binding protein
MWRAIGINVELSIQENWGQITRGRHSIRNLSATMLWQDPSAALWRLFKPSVIEGRGWAWNNDEFVQHGQVMEVDPNPEARRQAFARMADIWEIEDPMGAVLYEEVQLYGMRESLDWTPYALPYMDFGPRNITS